MPPEIHLNPADLDLSRVIADQEAIRRVNPQLLGAISTLGEGEIALRVRLLLEDRDRAQTVWPRIVAGIVTVGALTILCASYGPILRLIHEATEIAIRLLP